MTSEGYSFSEHEAFVHMQAAALLYLSIVGCSSARMVASVGTSTSVTAYIMDTTLSSSMPMPRTCVASSPSPSARVASNTSPTSTTLLSSTFTAAEPLADADANADADADADAPALEPANDIPDAAFILYVYCALRRSSEVCFTITTLSYAKANEIVGDMHACLPSMDIKV
jgi:hypothetical protein